MTENHRKIEENNAWDHLSKWDTIVDERIRKVIGDGDMSWHPKAGQPFEFEDETVPEEFRLAYKIMKDNDAIPPWMALGYTLRDKHKKIHKRIKQYARDYVARQQKAIEMGSFILHREADERWNKAVRQWKMDVGKYNSELLNYNLEVPESVGQMIPIDPQALVDKALAQAQK
ncbi:MAG: DUF1992 domain-containing protein [Chloroflexota bacterium]